jgi:membrane-bound ClpP family serine protease
MGRKMTVRSVTAEETIGNMASHQALDLLVGKTGKTLSELRPSGIVDFEGRRIDAISEGILIAEGLPVLCISAQGGHVVVKPFVVTGFENEQISNMDLN